MAVSRVSYNDWITSDGLKRLESWARDGLTNEQIAKNIGCHVSTLQAWIKKYKEIAEALKSGKRPVDFEVENTLLKRAKGYEYEEVKTVLEVLPSGEEKKRIEKRMVHVPPDTSAAIFWLKNRKPSTWRRMSPEFTAKVESEIALNKAQEQKLLAELERETQAMQAHIEIVDGWQKVREDDYIS